MNNSTKSYKIVILDETYTIRSDEAEEHIMRAAKMVDELMHDILHKSSSAASPKKIAVMVSLCLASKLVASEETVDACARKESMLQQSIDMALASYEKVDQSDSTQESCS